MKDSFDVDMKFAKIFFAAAVFAAALAARSDSAGLKSEFANPPADSLPRTWWHWIDGNVTKSGITADLEAMRKAGIGSATILDITSGLPRGPVKTLSPEWYGLVNHAVKEAARLGMKITVHNCPGWSSSGGPWIRPEDAMKEIAWTQTVVDGGREIHISLPKAEGKRGFYRDVAVVAYPSIPGDGEVFRDLEFKILAGFPKAGDLKVPPYIPDYITVTQKTEDLLGDDWRKVAMLRPAKGDRPGDSVTFQFEKPYSAGGFKVSIGGPPYDAGAVFEISVSDDGKNFRRHFRTSPMKYPGGETGFPLVSAKFIRVELAEGNGGEPVSLYGMSLSSSVKIPDIDLKTFAKWGTIPRRPVPSGIIPIGGNSIMDVSKFMDSEGNLVWNAPKGKWTILRFGMVCNGRGNHPATPEGTGLECDKMSKRGVDAAWSGMMERIVSGAGALAGKTFSATLVDSYEVGPQNWTDDFPAEFERLRGYGIVRNLPILAGKYVESAEYSERFLRDFRRTIADLFAKYYGEYFAEVVHKSGLELESEPYGGPFDELLQGRYADVPMGEFWGGWNNTGNARLASNIAQINGRKYVQAETFTSGPGERWKSVPAAHKLQGDNAFSEGVNRFVFHSYAHQPYETDGAGLTMGIWGFHFNRKNTLWDYYDGWLSYVGRAQHLLQQGKFVSSVLYVAPEEVPSITPLTQIYAAKDFYCGANLFAPALPAGYAGNVCEPRAILDSVSVSGGKIRLKSGMEYGLLAVNNVRVASPGLLKKIQALAREGANILLGKRPDGPLGLEGYPEDSEFREAVEGLWGGLDGVSKTSKRIGAGRVFFGAPIAEVLSEIGLAPDFEAFLPGGKRAENIKYIHKKTEELDIYFVSNQSEGGSPVLVTAKFAAECASPEIWDAESGKTSAAPVWKSGGNRTEIPLWLFPSQSLFVVFPRGAGVRPHFESAEWVPDERRAPRLAVDRAVWRSEDGSKCVDVTAIVRSKIDGDSLKIGAASSELGGDCAPNKPKVLEICYSMDGEKKTLAAKEWGTAEIKCPHAPKSGVWGKGFDVEFRGGKPVLRAWENGTLEARAPDGVKISLAAGEIPKSLDLSRDWEVELGKSGGKKIKMPMLKSLSESADPDVKYFSGTSVYRKSFEVPAEFFAGRIAAELDLGDVRDIARARLNGEELGNLWHPPFARDVTGLLKEGKNFLEIEVANTWFNRLVGDERLPDDAEWKPKNKNGQLLKSFPEWFLKGEKSPAGRRAFTTFRNWTKDDKLSDSGLIGPVILRPSRIIPLGGGGVALSGDSK